MDADHRILSVADYTGHTLCLSVYEWAQPLLLLSLPVRRDVVGVLVEVLPLLGDGCEHSRAAGAVEEHSENQGPWYRDQRHGDGWLRHVRQTSW